MKIRALLSRQYKETLKREQQNSKITQGSVSFTKSDREVSNIVTSRIKQALLNIKFKRLVHARQNALKIGKIDLAKKLEKEMKTTESFFNQHSKNEASAKNRLFKPQKPNPTKNTLLTRDLKEAEKKYEEVLEEILEMEESGFASPKIMIHKQIELTEFNIEQAKHRIKLLEKTTHSAATLQNLKRAIEEDTSHLAKLRQDLKQFE